MPTIELPAPWFQIVFMGILLLMVAGFIWGISLHFGAFGLGCLFMFGVSSIRYKGQSLIGGTNRGTN